VKLFADPFVPILKVVKPFSRSNRRASQPQFGTVAGNDFAEHVKWAPNRHTISA